MLISKQMWGKLWSQLHNMCPSHLVNARPIQTVTNQVPNKKILAEELQKAGHCQKVFL